MFDPYREWLGISKSGTRVTYYDVLGVAPSETEADAIKEAALRQTAHVRVFQTGPYAEECTRILNEIARARAALVNPQTRREYDDGLAAKKPMPAADRPLADVATAKGPAHASAPVLAPPDLAPPDLVDHRPLVHRRPRGSCLGHCVGAIVYVGLLTFAGAASFWIASGGVPMVVGHPAGPAKAAVPAKAKNSLPAPIRGNKSP